MMKRKKMVLLLSVFILSLSGCSKDDEDKKEFYKLGIEELESGSLNEALSFFSQALAGTEKKVGRFEIRVLNYQAETQYRLGSYKAASNTYAKLLKEHKPLAQYYYMSGASLAKGGDGIGGAKAYQDGVKIDKKSELRELSLLAVGTSLREQGESDLAMELYEEALGDRLETPKVYNQMGLGKLEQKHYEEALSYFQLGMDLDKEKECSDLYYNQGITYESMGEFDHALAIFEEYLNQFGEDEKVEREITFLKTR